MGGLTSHMLDVSRQGNVVVVLTSKTFALCCLSSLVKLHCSSGCWDDCPIWKCLFSVSCILYKSQHLQMRREQLVFNHSSSHLLWLLASAFLAQRGIYTERSAACGGVLPCGPAVFSMLSPWRCECFGCEMVRTENMLSTVLHINLENCWSVFCTALCSMHAR